MDVFLTFFSQKMRFSQLDWITTLRKLNNFFEYLLFHLLICIWQAAEEIKKFWLILFDVATKNWKDSLHHCLEFN